jgi:hypothetical protein
MNKCDNLPDNCTPKKCEVKKPVTIQDIDTFFDISYAQECSTSIVYLNRYNNGVVMSKLYVKNIDSECNIFYTKKNDYYFVYPKFIQNIILWSAHPKAFGVSGYLGNHISIGTNNNGKSIDIHETIYNSTKSNAGHVLIAGKKHINYTIDKDNKTLISSAVNNQLAQVLWDDICCPNSGNQLTGGTHGMLKLVKPKKTKLHSLTISDILDDIIAKCKSIKTSENKEHYIRIPYVRRSQLLFLAQKILKKIKLDISMIISDSYTKTSILVI